MIIKKLSKIAACGLAALLAFSPVITGSELTSYAYNETTATVAASVLNVRSGPGTNYSRVTELSAGNTVTIVDEERGSDGEIWAKIRVGGQNGYVMKSYLKRAAEYRTDQDFEAALSAQGFPESYKTALRSVHAEYPNWRFVAQNTGLGWEEVIREESVIGRNLVASSSRSSWKSTAPGAYDWKNDSWPGFDSNYWVAASEEIIRYYMDPRNFLNPVYIFQFLDQRYDASTQNAAGVETLAKGTFMEGRSSGAYSGGEGPSVNEDNAPAGDDSGSAPIAPDGSAVNSDNASQNHSVQNSGSSNSQMSAGSSSIGVISGPPGSTQGASSAGTSQSNTQSSTQSSGSTGASSAAPSSSSSGSQVIGVISGAPTGKIIGSPEEKMDAVPEGSVFEVLHVASNASVVSSGKNKSYSDPVVSGGDSGSSSSGSASNSGVNYIDAIMRAAKESGVNPYVLTSMIIQEQGAKGTSGLISGTSSSYPGVYNYFNVQAYADGNMNAVTRGLWWASQSGDYGRPWNTREKAIVGGAEFYGENYLERGQDTLYLKKFNVSGNNRYQHQYMTNVEGAAAEGSKLSQAYSESMKQEALSFRIPVYTGMPESPETLPTGDGNPNNKLSGLWVNGFSLTPSFSMDTESYDLIIDPSVTSVEIGASAIRQTASVSGTGTVWLNGNAEEFSVQVTAGNGDVRVYTIHVRRQSGGQTGGGSSGNTSSGFNSRNDSDAGHGPGVEMNSAPAAPDGTSAQQGFVSLVGPSGQ